MLNAFTIKERGSMGKIYKNEQLSDELIKIKHRGKIYTPDYLVKIILNHTKQCFGYSLVEKERPGEFSVENALSHKVPRGPLWGKLQKGEDVINLDGEVVHPSDVLGEKRKGRKFSYVTDTMYFPEISDYVRASDILLCEAMFTEDLKEDALSKKHMTAMQAATIAKDGEVDMLCLQHYSPRYSDKDLKLLLEEAKTIFENTILTRDRMIFEVANHESP